MNKPFSIFAIISQVDGATVHVGTIPQDAHESKISFYEHKYDGVFTVVMYEGDIKSARTITSTFTAGNANKFKKLTGIMPIFRPRKTQVKFRNVNMDEEVNVPANVRVRRRLAVFTEDLSL